MSPEERIKIYNVYHTIMDKAIGLSNKSLFERKKLLFEWVKTGKITFKEFSALSTDFVETDNYLQHFKSSLTDSM